MTRGGQLVSRFMMRLLRHTAYVEDAVRNQRKWEEQYRSVIARQP
jgi:hypothetical protein